jgi:hypothetical protein
MQGGKMIRKKKALKNVGNISMHKKLKGGMIEAPESST